MLKWVFERVAGFTDAVDTPIGMLPAPGSLDTTGLGVANDDLDTLLSVDVDGWKAAIPQIRAHYAQFGDHLPDRLTAALDELDAKLANA